MKFLLVEDDDQFAEALIAVLADHHYLVDRATDGDTGMEMAEAFSYDLLLLDWMLPQLDGIQVCQELRAAGNRTPIILMTARDTDTDKIAGLDAGADDYLVKPFGFEELLARIRALLRRSEGNVSPVLQWGELRFDPRSAEVSYRNELISLTPKEYALLEMFLRNPSRIFSLDDLLDKIWPFEDAPHVSAVRTHVKGLRQKFKRVGLNDVIETVYGLGYRLAPVDAAEQQVDSTDLSTASANSIDLTALWQPVQTTYRQRVANLADTLHGLQVGGVNEAVRQQIITEAHALKGSLGSFGFSTVAANCQEIENILLANGRLDSQHISRLDSLVTDVQQALTTSKKPGSTMLGGTSMASLLIVGDQPELLNRLQTLLQPWGFELRLLSQPQRLLDMLDQSVPDLVILDVEMSHSSGFELCQLLRNDPRGRELPVLLLSAYAEADTIQQVFSAGGDDFIRKPIVAPELVVRVLNWLERARTRRLRSDIDHLTGVANRQKSTQDLSRLLRLAHRQGQPFCFALLKIDSLKHIDNQYGQRAGDFVLQRFGECLGEAFRTEDVVARWGIDEFVVGLYGANRNAGVQRLTEFLQTWQGEQFISDNYRFQVTFSAGIAVFPQDETDLQRLYRAASGALSQAQSMGCNRVLTVV